MGIIRSSAAIIVATVTLLIAWGSAIVSANTIKIWLPEPPSYAQLEQVIRSEIAPRFEAETGTRVEIATLSYNQAWRQLMTGSGPDVVFTQGDLGLFMGQEGFLAPLNRYIDSWEGRHAVPPELLRPQFQMGTIFGLPLLIGLDGVIVYNKEVFADSGLDPEYPLETWADLEEAVMRTTRLDGDWIRPGIDMASWNAESVFRVFLYQAGGRMWSEDHKHLEFHSDQGVQAAKQIAKLYQKAFPIRGVRAVDQATPLAFRVAEGNIAMAFGGMDLANRTVYHSRNYDTSHLGMFVARKDSSTNPVANALSPGIAISSFSTNPTEAWRFIEWLYRPDNIVAFHNRLGWVVPRTDVSLSAYDENPLFPSIHQYLMYAVASPTLPPELATRAQIFYRADGSDTADLRRDLMSVYLGDLEADFVLRHYGVMWQERLDQAWEDLLRI